MPPETPNEPPAGGSTPDAPLQFDRIEHQTQGPATGGPPLCTICGTAIRDTYYTANGTVVCSRCRDALAARDAVAPGPPELARGVALGLGGGVVGAAAYYAVLRFGHFHLSLLSILIGFLVARGVTKGSGGRGGPLYQAIAVVLTYVSLAGALVAAEADSVPGVIERIGLGQFLMIGLSLPVREAASDIILIFIYGLALYEAWRVTKRAPLALGGPYAVGAAPPGLGVSPGATGG